MKTQMKWTMLALVTGVLVACAGTQPAPPCAVGHGGFAAKFTPVGTAPTGACNRPGDIVGVQKYRQTDNTQDVFLRSEWLSEGTFGAIGDDPSVPLSSGKLSGAVPGADSFCTVPTLTAATGTDPNGVDLTYTWSNVKFYVTGKVPGTQFTADLTITGTGCTGTYKVDALFPVVVCLDSNTGAVDATLCQEPDAWWSGLTMNPLFATACSPIRNDASDPDIYGAGDSHTCVPAGNIPSLAP